jgi:hypothetical protein
MANTETDRARRERKRAAVAREMTRMRAADRDNEPDTEEDKPDTEENKPDTEENKPDTEENDLIDVVAEEQRERDAQDED